MMPFVGNADRKQHSYAQDNSLLYNPQVLGHGTITTYPPIPHQISIDQLIHTIGIIKDQILEVEASPPDVQDFENVRLLHLNKLVLTLEIDLCRLKEIGVGNTVNCSVSDVYLQQLVQQQTCYQQPIQHQGPRFHPVQSGVMHSYTELKMPPEEHKPWETKQNQLKQDLQIKIQENPEEAERRFQEWRKQGESRLSVKNPPKDTRPPKAGPSVQLPLKTRMGEEERLKRKQDFQAKVLQQIEPKIQKHAATQR